MDISERNTLDTLSRSVWWTYLLKLLVLMPTQELLLSSRPFGISSEIQRVRIGLPMTTLELTALSFSSSCLRHLSYGRWYRTPLDFVGLDRFKIDNNWRYYTQLSHLLWSRFLSRPVTSRPWDRFPSDTWLCPDAELLPFGAAVPMGFSIIFLPAWSFHFPTGITSMLLRICSVYHAAFSIYYGAYYCIEMCSTRRKWAIAGQARLPPLVDQHPRSGFVRF